MNNPTPKPVQPTFFGRRIRVSHVWWSGLSSLLAGLWLLSTVLFAWPSQQLPMIGGLILSLSFLAGLVAFAVSVVVLFRRRDWRIALAGASGLAGVVLFVLSFLLAARKAGL